LDLFKIHGLPPYIARFSRYPASGLDRDERSAATNCDDDKEEDSPLTKMLPSVLRSLSIETSAAAHVLAQTEGESSSQLNKQLSLHTADLVGDTANRLHPFSVQ